MNITTFGQLIAGVLLNACAQLLLKIAAGSLREVADTMSMRLVDVIRLFVALFTNAYLLGGIALYAVSIGLWLVVLAKVPVTVAYPMLSIGYVFNAVMGYILFKESLSAIQVVGLVVIIVGVGLLNQK